MSVPTLPTLTPILVCRANKGGKLQIPRADIEKLLATNKAPFFDIYVEVTFIQSDDKGNPIVIEEKKDVKTLKTLTVNQNVVYFLAAVIQRT